MVSANRGIQAALTQKIQIGQGTFGAGQDQQVEPIELLRRIDVMQGDIRLPLKRVKICIRGSKATNPCLRREAARWVEFDIPIPS